MKKNLGKFIALSLLTASVFSFGQCKIGQCEYAIKSEPTTNGGHNLVGTADKFGDFARNSPTNYSGWINYPAWSKTNYDNVDVTMNFDYTKPGIAYGGDDANKITSASALDVVYENTKIVCDGDIRVVNESKLKPLDSTANGIYAKNRGEIDFSNANSVYIASYKNVKKGDAISAKNGGKVSISTDKVNGFTKIIGNVDFGFSMLLQKPLKLAIQQLPITAWRLKMVRLLRRMALMPVARRLLT